jgi:phenylacetate-CoA ligase
VTNIFGSREVGHVAARCPNGALHVNDETLIVETDASVSGDSGELLVTTLDPSPMPFIRYHMGDVATLSTVPCACGRSLTVISELLGRTGEVFHTEDGRMISPNFWCRVFMAGELTGAIRRFQIRYASSGRIRVLVEQGSKWRPEDERVLKRIVGEQFSPRVKIELEFPQSIRPDVSGKYQMIVNET